MARMSERKPVAYFQEIRHPHPYPCTSCYCHVNVTVISLFLILHVHQLLHLDRHLISPLSFSCNFFLLDFKFAKFSKSRKLSLQKMIISYVFSIHLFAIDLCIVIFLYVLFINT